MMGEWKEIEDHTADAGIEVRSNHIADLFITAAIAFTELSTNPSTLEVGKTGGLRIKCVSSEPDLMLRDMLAELLVVLEISEKLPIEIKSISFDDDVIYLECIWGHWIDGKSESKMEIKAVTYHMLEVTQVEEGWYGKVLFDI
jgi:SHS2 domain-containing protein